MDKTFKISMFSNRFAKVPSTAEFTLRDLAKGLLLPSSSSPVSEKNRLPLWSPTIFSANRSAANAIEISCLVFDLDDGTDIAHRLSFEDYHYIYHSSFSHTYLIHKWRLILPLENPIPAKDWKRAAQAAKMLWDKTIGEGVPDSNALTDSARMYYRFAYSDIENSKEIHKKGAHKGERLLNLEYSHIPEEKPRVTRYQRWEPRSTSSKIGVETLFHNPELRMKVALKAGASIEENTARNITCPSCGEREVYFSIDTTLPGSVTYPHCNRANKCQWWGKLEDLL